MDRIRPQFVIGTGLLIESMSMIVLIKMESTAGAVAFGVAAGLYSGAMNAYTPAYASFFGRKHIAQIQVGS